jgi:hypothetical protein
MNKLKRINRSAASGKFVDNQTAKDNPSETVCEQVKPQTLEVVHIFADGRRMLNEVKPGEKFALYGDEIEIEVNLK